MVSRVVMASLLLCWPGSPVVADVVKPPRGWSVERVKDTTFIGNENTTVTVGPWQSLSGRTADVWLSELAKIDPEGGRLISAQKVKAETVDGAFSIMRRAKFGGKQGIAVLYSCPGRPGEARLLKLDVKNGSLTDTVRGALYGEKICKAEIALLRQSGAESDSGIAGVSNSTTTSREAYIDQKVGAPAELNDAIPATLRPIRAELYSDWVWKGFPAVRTLKLVMALTFEDGTKLGCSDWAPDGSVTLDYLASLGDCVVPEKKSKNPIYGFDPGQRLSLKFGTLSGLSIDGIEGSAISMKGGDLLMTKKGEIAIGDWSIAHTSTTAATARSTGTKRRGLVGRYYVDGHTITVVTQDNEVLHGLVGFSRDKAGLVDTVYLNGDWYRDLDK